MASKLGVSQSTAVTCIKPSGTVSQLTDSASGIHPRHSEYYIRRVRCNKDDPLTKFMVDNGVPMEDCAMNPASTAVSVVGLMSGRISTVMLVEDVFGVL
jgi:ribonucleoside-diphosphate reductase alpha chain